MLGFSCFFAVLLSVSCLGVTDLVSRGSGVKGLGLGVQVFEV